MTWYLSKNKLSEFYIIPRFHWGGDYISIWWGRREAVIYTGKSLDKQVEEEITFSPVPKPRDGVAMMSLREFIGLARDNILADEDGIGFFADVQLVSNIAVEFINLQAQGEMFVRRKQQGKWYPTHVVWYFKY